MREVETFAFWEIAPIFEDTTYSASNVVMSVGVCEQD